MNDTDRQDISVENGTGSKSALAGLSFWILWTLVSAVAAGVSWVLTFLGMLALYDAFSSAIKHNWWLIAAGPLHGGLQGLAQWLILRRRFRRVHWWIAATAVWATAWLVLRLMMSELEWIVQSVEAGLVLGIGEWVVLREDLRSVLLIPAAIVGQLLGEALAVNFLGGGLLSLTVGEPVLIGVTLGMSTGFVLLALSPQAEETPA